MAGVSRKAGKIKAKARRFHLNLPFFCGIVFPIVLLLSVQVGGNAD